MYGGKRKKPAEGEGGKKGGRSRRLLANFLGLLLAGACVYYLAQTLYSNWSALEGFDLGRRPLYWLYSLPFLVAASFLEPVAWGYVLKKFGRPLSTTRCYAIFRYSQLGRYLPGKVWTYVGTVALAERDDVPRSVSLSSALVVTFVGTVIAPSIFLTTLAFSGEIDPWAALAANLAYFLLCGLVLGSPWPEKILGKIFRRMEIEELPFRFTFKEFTYLAALFYGGYLVWGVGAWFAVNAVMPLGPRLSTLFVGSYGVAVVAGFYVLFVPGGIGVREGLNTWIMAFFMPLPAAAAVAVLLRFWSTVGDGVFVVVAAGLSWAEGRSKKGAAAGEA